VGAGGGSIIRLDELGSLKVGPRSVGADPGPACYGKGTQSALTDAFLTAGWLADGQLLAGRIPLKLENAKKALEPVASGLGLGVEETADAAIALAIAMMAAETSAVLAQRGVDAPEFSLVAFGGAGPLIGALLAEAVYINRVIMPQVPGVLSALGASNANLEIDLIRPVYTRLSNVAPDDLRAIHKALEDEARATFREEAEELPLSGSETFFSADMRYEGQGFDVTIPLQGDWLSGGNLEAIANAFHAGHQAAYGYSKEGSPVWLKEVRSHVVGTTPKPSAANIPPWQRDEAVRCSPIANRRAGLCRQSVSAFGTGGGRHASGAGRHRPARHDGSGSGGLDGAPDRVRCPHSGTRRRQLHCSGGDVMMIQSVLDEVLANHFRAVADEMSYRVLRAAHTTFVKETQDYATALITVKGEAFAYPYKTGVTSLMGIPVSAGIEAFDDWQPGDVMITNDPYATRGMVMHLPDLHLLKPIFHDGKLICFAWTFMHCTDVGGLVAGSSDPNAYEAYQEGFRLRPVKLFRQGVRNEDVWNFIADNSRIPDLNAGDLEALLSAIACGGEAHHPADRALRPGCAAPVHLPHPRRDRAAYPRSPQADSERRLQFRRLSRRRLCVRYPSPH
jgi:5-oxoprolinase (ATP-hydrolysing)